MHDSIVGFILSLRLRSGFVIDIVLNDEVIERVVIVRDQSTTLIIAH